MPDRRAPTTEPTGLKRIDAAAHCGVSPGHFDRMVREGVLPAARNIGGVKIWLRRELDAALFAIPAEGDGGGANSCDALFDVTG